MPYISQQQKKEIQAKLKPIFKEYGIKATLGIHNHSTIVVNIWSSPIDFIGNYNRVIEKLYCYTTDYQPRINYLDVNHFWYHKHFDGEALECLIKIINVLNEKNGVEVEDGDYGIIPYFYIDINIGQWNKSYKLLEIKD